MKYPKINSLYKRFTAGSFKNQFMDGRGGGTPEFSTPEFEALYNSDYPFVGTEKIDGTNIRLDFLKTDILEGTIKGRTDNSQIPTILFSVLEKIKANLLIKIPEVFNTFDRIIFFGEGYGAKIQKGGGNYIPDGVDFILFDIWIDGIWLRRNSILEIAEQVDLDVVPIAFEGSLRDAEKIVKGGYFSTVSVNEMKAEGLVLVPKCGILDRMGQRIITKIKSRDY